MKKVVLKVVFVVGSLLTCVAVANAQIPISFSGQVGYASPGGGWFKNDAGEKMSKFGIGVDFDVLYHLEQMDNKLGVGLTYNSSFLFGADMGDSGLDIGLYGLSLYGVKGQYRFFNSKVSPYGSLGLGLSQFAEPDITITNGDGTTQTYKGEKSFGFGIRPEIGVEFGAFVISCGYIVPMKYKIEDVKESASCFQVNLGVRITLFDR